MSDPLTHYAGGFSPLLGRSSCWKDRRSWNLFTTKDEAGWQGDWPAGVGLVKHTSEVLPYTLLNSCPERAVFLREGKDVEDFGALLVVVDKAALRAAGVD